MANQNEIEIKYKADASELTKANKELDSDAKLLKKEFILQREQAKALGDQYGAVEAEIKYLNKQQEINAEKTKGVNAQYEKAVEIYGENSQEAKKLKGQLLDLQITNEQLGNKAKTAAEGLKKIPEELEGMGDKADKASKDLGKVPEGLQSAGSKMLDIAGKLGPEVGNLIGQGALKAAKMGFDALVGATKAVAGAAAAGATGIYAVTKGASEAADDLITMGDITGYSTDELQKMAYAAELVDVSVETMTGSQTKLTKSMDASLKGTGAQAEAFTRLGINVKNADGTLRDSKDVWNETIDALGKVSNETERDALAMDLMGKSAKELNPLIKAGSKSLKDLGDEAEKMGMVVSEMNLEKLGDMDDSFQKLKATTKALQGNFGAVFAPLIGTGMDKATEAVGQLSAALSDGFQMEDIHVIDDILQNITSDITSFIQTELPKLINIIIPVMASLVSSVASILPTLLPVLFDGVNQLLTSLLEMIRNNKEEVTNTIGFLITSITTFILESLPLIIELGLELLLALAEGIANSIPELIPVLVDAIITITSTLLSHLPEILSVGAKILLELIKGIGSVLGDLATYVKGVGSDILTWIGDGLKGIVDIGGNLVRGLWDGIRNMGGWLKDKVGGWASDVIGSVRGFFGVHSPSTVFAEIGDYLMQGLGAGIDRGQGTVLDSVKEMGSNIIDITSRIKPDLPLPDLQKLNEMSQKTYGNSQIPLRSNTESLPTAVGGEQMQGNVTFQNTYNITVRDKETMEYIFNFVEEKKRIQEVGRGRR